MDIIQLDTFLRLVLFISTLLTTGTVARPRRHHVSDISTNQHKLAKRHYNHLSTALRNLELRLPDSSAISIRPKRSYSYCKYLILAYDPFSVCHSTISFFSWTLLRDFLLRHHSWHLFRLEFQWNVKDKLSVTLFISTPHAVGAVLIWGVRLRWKNLGFIQQLPIVKLW